MMYYVINNDNVKLFTGTKEECCKFANESIGRWVCDNDGICYEWFCTDNKWYPFP